MIDAEAILEALAPLVQGRCYPIMFPQMDRPVWPAVRYTPIGGTVNATNCAADCPDSDDRVYQIDCVAETFKDARDLSQSVRTAFAAIGVNAASAAQVVYDDETRTFRAIQDFTFY